MNPETHRVRRVGMIAVAGVAFLALTWFVFMQTTGEDSRHPTGSEPVPLSEFAPLLPCGMAEIDWDELPLTVTWVEQVRTGDLQLSFVRFKGPNLEALLSLQKHFFSWCGSAEMQVVESQSSQGIAWHGVDQGSASYGMLSLQSSTEAIAFTAVSLAERP